MAKQKGLGKGLGALMLDDQPEATAEGPYKVLPVYKIEPNPDQPRREFDPEALDAVADKAIERNIGARGLRAVMEGLLTGIMY